MLLIRCYTAATLGVALVTLAACQSPPRASTPTAPHVVATPPLVAAVPVLRLTGSVSYRQRIALSPDAVVVVELSDTASPPGQGVLAERRIPLQGRQLPVAFSLEVEQHKIEANHRYTIRGGVLEDARATWVSTPVPVNVHAGETIDVGVLNMAQVSASAFGKPEAYRARGNEPGWDVTISADALVLGTEAPRSRVTYGPPLTANIAGGTRYSTGDGTVSVTAWNRPCKDTMSGMPYPQTVEVARGADQSVLHGCGGDPASLLQGPEWTVERINDAALPADAKGTLQFGVDGRLTGKAFCNSYTGTYKLTGEGLQFGSGAVTMMACLEPLMSLQARFFDVLNKLDRFDTTPEGALLLRASDGGNIRAVRLVK